MLIAPNLMAHQYSGFTVRIEFILGSLVVLSGVRESFEKFLGYRTRLVEDKCSLLFIISNVHGRQVGLKVLVQLFHLCPKELGLLIGSKGSNGVRSPFSCHHLGTRVLSCPSLSPI